MDIPSDQSPAVPDASSIEKEHVVQLGMLKALCDAVEEELYPAKIHEILQQLTSYSELHFMSEELLMRMYAYPDYDDHVLDHTNMTERLNKLIQDYIKGPKEMVVQNANEIREFLVAHINSRDQALVEFLSEKQ